MAYISKEDVKAIRDELKATFPKFKFGVRKSTGSMSVIVNVKQGPAEFSDILRNQYGDYAQINPYHTGQYGKHSKFFEKIIEIIKTAPMRGEGYNKKGWYDRSDAMTDYFDTAYYMSINVGDWDKPYACSK
jgi:hypothetical protein